MDESGDGRNVFSYRLKRLVLLIMIGDFQNGGNFPSVPTFPHVSTFPEASFSAFTFSAPLQPRTNFPPTGSLTLEATGDRQIQGGTHEETTLPRRRRPVRSD